MAETMEQAISSALQNVKEKVRKEKERLEKEKDLLTDRLSQIDKELSSLNTDVQRAVAKTFGLPVGTAKSGKAKRGRAASVDSPELFTAIKKVLKGKMRTGAILEALANTQYSDMNKVTLAKHIASYVADKQLQREGAKAATVYHI